VVLSLVRTLLGWPAANDRAWTPCFSWAYPSAGHCAQRRGLGTAGDIHHYLVYVRLAFILLPIAAALDHHCVMRDQVLQRMLPAG
jgi:cytochrome b561